MIDLKQYLYSISPLQEKTWLKIEPLFSEVFLKKGDSFVEEGRAAKQFAFLKSGVIRAFYRGQGGKEYNKFFFTNPSIVGGYSSLITGLPNQFIQQVLSDCELLVALYHLAIVVTRLAKIGSILSQPKKQTPLEGSNVSVNDKCRFLSSGIDLLPLDNYLA